MTICCKSSKTPVWHLPCGHRVRDNRGSAGPIMAFVRIIGDPSDSNFPHSRVRSWEKVSPTGLRETAQQNRVHTAAWLLQFLALIITAVVDNHLSFWGNIKRAQGLALKKLFIFAEIVCSFICFSVASAKLNMKKAESWTLRHRWQNANFPLLSYSTTKLFVGSSLLCREWTIFDSLSIDVNRSLTS